jgi:hypothetical protein
MAKLLIREGDRTTVYEVLDEVITIGRSEDAAVRVGDATVGGKHCQVRSVPGVGFKLIDLESRNGTKVNGSFVNQHVLRDGDEIQLGAVRISFRDEDAVEMAPAAAPPRPAVVAARPAPARPAPARPAAARPAPPRPPRERDPGREPYRRRQPSNAPLIMLGGAVGLLLMMVAALIFAGPWFNLSPNQSIFFDMRELQKKERYKEALELAKQANPSGHRDAYEKIQKLKAEIQEQLLGVEMDTAGNQAQREYRDVETFVIRNKDENPEAAVAKLREYITKWKNTFWGSQAEILLEQNFGGGSGGGIAEDDTDGQKKIDREFRAATKRATELTSVDRFGAAREVIEKFWEKNQLYAEDMSAWTSRKDGAIEEILSRAEDRWEELAEKAEAHVDKGEYEKAKEIYGRIRDRFGLEDFEARAKREISRLE